MDDLAEPHYDGSNKGSVASSRAWVVFVSGLLAIVFGTLINEPVAFAIVFLRWGGDVPLDSEMVETLIEFFLMTVGAVAFLGFILVTEIAIILVLPLLYFRGKLLPAKWIIFSTALAGAVLFGLQPSITWCSHLFSDGTLILPDHSWIWILRWLLFRIGGGALLGGLFGASLSYFERRARSAANGAKGFEALRGPRSLRNMTPGGWMICVMALATAFLHVWVSSAGTLNMQHAARAFGQHQAGILTEAQMLLDDARESTNGYRSYLVSQERASLQSFAEMGDVSGYASVAAKPERVTVGLSDGSHIFVIPEPTSATLPLLRDRVAKGDSEYMVKINDHLYLNYWSPL